MRLLHRCVNNAEWDGNELFCRKCGKALAIRYILNGEVIVYCFQRFRKDRKTIEKRQDTYEVANKGNLVGSMETQEWEDLLDNVRRDASELFYLPPLGAWIPEESDNPPDGEADGGGADELAVETQSE